VGSIILFEANGKDGYRAIVLQTATGRSAADTIRREHVMTFPLEQRLSATEPDSDATNAADLWQPDRFEAEPDAATGWTPAVAPASPPPPPYDHARLAKERSVRGQFVRDVMAATNLSEPEKHSIMRAGLLALDGHDDLEVR